jgi:hypothetical protein
VPAVAVIDALVSSSSSEATKAYLAYHPLFVGTLLVAAVCAACMSLVPAVLQQHRTLQFCALQ